MADEQLRFSILADDRASRALLEVGRRAAAAGDDVIGLGRRLDEVGRKSATARVGLDGDKQAMASLTALDARLLAVGRKVVDPKISVEGAAKASAEITALDAQLDKLAAKSEAATAAVGAEEGGLASPGGMGALIGAGVVLSPILATVATGVGAFGAAAAGTVAPVLKASQAAGGLQANLKGLDPEQRRLATGLTDLEGSYKGFSKSLEPETVSVFGKGIHLVTGLLHEAQPVAAATGRALGGVVDQVDTELSGQQWRDFFGFMGREAGPDVALLGDNFTQLLGVLPPILEELQPLATGFLHTTSGVLSLSGAIARVEKQATDAGGSSGGLSFLAKAAGRAYGDLVPGAPAASKLATALGNLGNAASGKASPGLSIMAAEAEVARTATQRLTSDVSDLDKLLNNQSAYIAWKQAQQAATKALEGGSAALDGNSAKALANRQQVILSTQRLSDLIQNEQKTGTSVGKMSGQLEDQIQKLQASGDKSNWMKAQIRALEKALNALHSEKVAITVTADGSWAIQQGGGRRVTNGPPEGAAAGLLVTGGIAGKDSVPILAQQGELVVPTPIVRSGAVDHLRGRIPGFTAAGQAAMASGRFAGGGIVGSIHTGTPSKVGPWAQHDWAATQQLLEAATAKAAAAGLNSFGGGFPGGGSSGPGAAAAQAYARSVLGAYGWGQSQFPPLQALWNQESGWRWNALNAASGAYGIPQSLPADKMAAAGPDWRTNPATQIRWGLGYIKGRYGSPAGAESHEIREHWYDNANSTPRYLPPGITLAVNGTGRPEPVGTAAVQGAKPARSGPLVQIDTINVRERADITIIQQKLSWAITAAGLG